MSKICKQCDLNLSLDNFYKNGKYYFGKCKVCYKNNIDKQKVKNYNKKHYTDNKEVLKEKRLDWLYNNPDYYVNYYKNNKHKY